MATQVVEQQVVGGREGDHDVVGLSCVAPHHAQVERTGQDVLIGHAVVGLPLPVLVGRLDRLHLSGRDVGKHHLAAIHLIDLEGDALLGAAVELCGLLNHVDFLVAFHAGYHPVVLDAHQQMTAVVVGKRRQRAGYLAGIVNLELEVLMVVLALRDE